MFYQQAAVAVVHDGSSCEGRQIMPSGTEGLCDPDKPMLTDWCSARAYCAWVGASLCPPALWSFACTNGDKTAYPYGDKATLVCAGQHDAGALPGCHGVEAPFDQIHDMSGNAAEWVDACPYEQPVLGTGGASGGPAQVITYCTTMGGGAYDKVDGNNAPELACKPGQLLEREQPAGFRCCALPPCEPGSSEACYSGPAGTLGKGACAAGKRTCQPDGTGFGPCEGEVTPQPESCLTPLDDDCDGVANEDGEGCDCAPTDELVCYGGPASTLDVGPCHAGTQRCLPGGHGFEPCKGEVTPQPESCLTPLDDDCDGATNEEGEACVCVPSLEQPCFEADPSLAGVGACKAGTQRCDDQGLSLGPCEEQVLPGVELCGNGADEDCDRFVDERGKGQPCPNQVQLIKTFAGVGPVIVTGLTPTSDGGLVVAGTMRESLSLTSPPLGQPTGTAAFVASLDASANVRWATSVGEIAQSAAMASVGDQTYVAAEFGAFTGGLVQAGVVALDGQGSKLWAFDIKASIGSTRVSGIAAAKGVGVSVLVTFDGAVKLAGTTYQRSSSMNERLLVNLDPTGALRSVVPLRLGCLASSCQGHVALEPSGAAWVALGAQGVIELGELKGTSVNGGVDLCLARVDGSDVAHARCVATEIDELPLSLSTHEDGTLTLGATPLEPFGQGPLIDSFDVSLVRLDAAGQQLSSTLLKTSLGGPLQLSLGPRGAGLVASTNGHLAALDADLRLRGSFVVELDSVGRVAPAGADDVWLAFSYGQLHPDLGDGPLPPAGSSTLAIVKLRLP